MVCEASARFWWAAGPERTLVKERRHDGMVMCASSGQRPSCGAGSSQCEAVESRDSERVSVMRRRSMREVMVSLVVGSAA